MCTKEFLYILYPYNIHLCHTNPRRVLLHYIHQPVLRSSLFPPCISTFLLHFSDILSCTYIYLVKRSTAFSPRHLHTFIGMSLFTSDLFSSLLNDNHHLLSSIHPFLSQLTLLICAFPFLSLITPTCCTSFPLQSLYLAKPYKSFSSSLVSSLIYISSLNSAQHSSFFIIISTFSHFLFLFQIVPSV